MKQFTKCLVLGLLLSLNLSLFANEVRIYITPPNNGSPIYGYTIEKRLKGQTKWETIALIMGREYVATSLEAAVYEFRVYATNKTGRTEPCDPVEADVSTATSINITCVCKDFTNIKKLSTFQKFNEYNYSPLLKQPETKIPYRPKE